ncbi:MAG: uroporphyrinogen-III synthase [Halioglobus sp.]|nr:uroporphyrinogen-III synthase [Halioglobus sp.]
MVAESAFASRRVLVTRPAGDASDMLCASLKMDGYKVFSQPLLVLQGSPKLTVAQCQMVLQLDLYQHVIFISSNAVHFGMPLIEDRWPHLPIAVNWYAIGAATAAKLERFNVEAFTPGRVMTSEGLLALTLLQNVRDQRVLIVKGHGGRDTLAQELTRRGALVDELPCYTRCLPEMHAGELAANLTQWRIDVILITSGEGLSNLQVLLTPAETNNLKRIALIVPSPRVAGMAHSAGFDQVVTAENASDLAMLRALKEWRRGTGGR